MKKIIRGIRNIIKWLPIIWKDRDYDYAFLYYIIIFKLKNMEDSFNNHGSQITDVDGVVEEMKRSRRLLQKVVDDSFTEVIMNKHEKEYGKNRCKRSSMTKDERIKEAHIYKTRLIKAEKVTDAASKLGFQNIGEKSRNWWY